MKIHELSTLKGPQGMLIKDIRDIRDINNLLILLDKFTVTICNVYRRYIRNRSTKKNKHIIKIL